MPDALPKDITDWLRQLAVEDRRDKLAALVESSRAGAAHSGADLNGGLTATPGMEFVAASDVEYVPQRPLLLKWGQRIPAAELTLILGREGRGKTLLAVQVAADVSVGQVAYAPRDVLFLSSEDSRGIIAARLEAAGADLDRVHLLTGVTLEDGRRDGFRLPRDRDFLENAVRRYRPGLVVIGGSLMGHVALDRDGNSQIGMRAVMEPLHDIAERFGVAALIVCHPNKSRHSDAGHRVSGSTAIVESARSALLMEFAEGEDGPRALAHFKHSNSAQEDTLLFDLEVVTLDSGAEVPRLVSAGESELTAADLLRQQLDGEKRPTKLAEAVAFLEAVLAGGDWHSSADIKQRATQAGIRDRTLKRALQAAGIEIRDEDTVPRTTSWRLPASRANAHAEQFLARLGPTGRTRIDKPNLTLVQPQSGQTHGVAQLDPSDAGEDVR